MLCYVLKFAHHLQPCTTESSGMHHITPTPHSTCLQQQQLHSGSTPNNSVLHSRTTTCNMPPRSRDREPPPQLHSGSPMKTQVPTHALCTCRSSQRVYLCPSHTYRLHPYSSHLPSSMQHEHAAPLSNFLHSPQAICTPLRMFLKVTGLCYWVLLACKLDRVSRAHKTHVVMFTPLIQLNSVHMRPQKKATTQPPPCSRHPLKLQRAFTRGRCAQPARLHAIHCPLCHTHGLQSLPPAPCSRSSQTPHVG